MHEKAATILDRRELCAALAASGALAVVPGAAQAHRDALALRLETRTDRGGTAFRVILEHAKNGPAAICSVQVFALGEAKPLKARFAPSAWGALGPMDGRLVIDRDQHLMALAQFADGSMIHARSFVSVTQDKTTQRD